MIQKSQLPLLALLLLLSCKTTQPTAGSWRSLFDGKSLQGWDIYLNRPKLSEAASESNRPYGLNNDPLNVFSVNTVDGEPAIRISGQVFGGISTRETFQNYHLQLQFKWGTTKWPPREKAKMDSGLLYHGVGEHGADGGSWLRSQELQVQQGDCGDYWGVAGAYFDIPARKLPDNNYSYDPKAKLLTFKDRTEVGRHCIKDPDAEKPTGEWNTIDLYCSGDTAVHMINGIVNMVLYHSRHTVNGVETPLTEGKIQIQSEGAEIFYRRIRIQAIGALPQEVIAKR